MEISLKESKIYLKLKSWDNFNQYKEVHEKFLVIIDEKVNGLYPKEISTLLDGIKHIKITLNEPENHKDLKAITVLTQRAVDFNLSRYDAVIAIGGGAIGDLGGFFSSIYKRGIRYYNFPTTLIAQVDSSIGGKTAMNFNGTKNLLGSFYPANSIFIDPYFLGSLEKKHFIGGLAEVAKYGLLNTAFLELLNKRMPSILEGNLKDLEDIIVKSAQIKGKIVESDYYETKGLRICLNLGHTIGHLIENKQPDKLNHGLSVLVGLDFAVYLSGKIGYLGRDDYKLRKEFLKVLLNYISKFNMKNYLDEIEKLDSDKKFKKGGVQFILPTATGYVVENIRKKDIKAYIREYCGEDND